MVDNVSYIKSKISIVDILSFYSIKVNRTGFISCPFHGEDKNPSAKVYSKQEKIHCFVCNKSWDVIAFVKQMENCDFQKAINFLDNAFRLGLNKPLTEEERMEWGRKQKEKEKQRLEALERAKFERKVLGDIIVEIRKNEATIAKCRPHNANKIDKYIYTECCDKYLEALSRRDYLEWMWLLAVGFPVPLSLYNEMYIYANEKNLDIIKKFYKEK